MKHEDLLKEMKDSIGTKDPIEYFSKMVDLFNLMFNQFDKLNEKLDRLKTHSVLAIQWEPKVASDMLAKQVNILRQDKEVYASEISALKDAFSKDLVTQNYEDFCAFWQNVLGYHPFLD